MSNYERITKMSIGEMADCLSNRFNCNLCSEDTRLSDSQLWQSEECDDNCIKHCKEWLESEVWE